MTLYQFNLLKEAYRWQALWTSGEYIGERFDPAHHVLLYQVENFYAEVFYYMADNRLCRLRSFKNTGQLAPHLRQISIPDLF